LTVTESSPFVRVCAAQGSTTVRAPTMILITTSLFSMNPPLNLRRLALKAIFSRLISPVTSRGPLSVRITLILRNLATYTGLTFRHANCALHIERRHTGQYPETRKCDIACKKGELAFLHSPRWCWNVQAVLRS